MEYKSRWRLEDLPLLHPGDVFLSSGGNGWTSKLERFVMRSHWTHAGLIEDKLGADYGILESVARGVAVGLLYYHYGCDDMAIYRLRDKSMDTSTQVQIIVNAKERGRYHYDYGIAYHICRQLGPRNAVELALQLIANKRPTTIPHFKDHYVVCSEFVQEVYSDAGIKLIPDEYLLLPRDIASLRHSKLIQIFGKDID